MGTPTRHGFAASPAPLRHAAAARIATAQVTGLKFIATRLSGCLAISKLRTSFVQPPNDEPSYTRLGVAGDEPELRTHHGRGNLDPSLVNSEMRGGPDFKDFCHDGCEG